MSKVAIILLSVIALLLVVQIADRWREPGQLKKVKDSIDVLEATVDRQAQAIKRLSVISTAVASEVVTTNQTAAKTPTSANNAVHDGNPRLGINFLKPVDRSLYNPAHMRGTLRYFEVPPPTLNYILSNDASTSVAQGLINSQLCGTDSAQPDQWVENTATSVIIDDDYKRYTFIIRPGVHWQRPAIAREKGYEWLAKDVDLSAKDFVFFADLIRDPNVQCPALKGYFEKMESIRAPDDHTLVVQWKEKEFTNLAFTLELLPYPRHVYSFDEHGAPIPKEQIGIIFNNHWFDRAKQFIGVGNYCVDVFEPNKTLSFVRYPDYWGDPLHFERIEWDGVTVQSDAKLVAFKNGQVHYWDYLPEGFFKSEILKGGEPRFNREHGREGAFGWEKTIGLDGKAITSHICWNMRRPQFSDRKTRQALAYAFPKQRIIDDVYAGLNKPLVGPTSASNPGWNKQLKDFSYDIAQAKSLLAEAGWKDSDGDGWLDREIDGKRTSLRFAVTYYGPHPVIPKILAIYRDELKPLGVELTLSPAEPNELERRRDDKDFDGMYSSWAQPILMDFEQIWHSKYAQEPKSSNYGGFANPRVDALSNKLRHTFDSDERNSIAAEIQAIINEDEPYLFTFDREFIFVWQNKTSGADDHRSTLDGVIPAFDRWHPLYNRDKSTWFFRN